MNNFNKKDLQIIIEALESYRADKSSQIIQKAMMDGMNYVASKKEDTEAEVEDAKKYLDSRKITVEFEINCLEETITLLKSKAIGMKNEIISTDILDQLSDIVIKK